MPMELVPLKDAFLESFLKNLSYEELRGAFASFRHIFRNNPELKNDPICQRNFIFLEREFWKREEEEESFK